MNVETILTAFFWNQTPRQAKDRHPFPLSTTPVLGVAFEDPGTVDLCHEMNFLEPTQNCFSTNTAKAEAWISGQLSKFLFLAKSSSQLSSS
jgi:hypothetical protein